MFTPIIGSRWAHTICLMFAADSGFLLNPIYESVNGFPDFMGAAASMPLPSWRKRKIDLTGMSQPFPLTEGSADGLEYDEVVSRFVGSTIPIYTRIPGNEGFVNGKSAYHRQTCVVCHRPTSGIPLRCQ